MQVVPAELSARPILFYCIYGGVLNFLITYVSRLNKAYIKSVPGIDHINIHCGFSTMLYPGVLSFCNILYNLLEINTIS